MVEMGTAPNGVRARCIYKGNIDTYTIKPMKLIYKTTYLKKAEKNKRVYNTFL